MARANEFRKELLPQEKAALAGKPFYVEGKPYRWILSFGWVVVGFYVCHETPLTIRVAHCSFIRQAHKDWGAFAVEGAAPNTEWRYEGNTLLTVPHILRVSEYMGEVQSGAIILG